MTMKYVVTDEEDKKFHNKLWDLQTRWRKKVLKPSATLFGMQLLIEGNAVVYDPEQELIYRWEEFYRELGIDCDFSNMRIPKDPGGFGRVIIMAQGITPQSGYDLCAKNFLCWKCRDKNLDEVIVSDRTTKSGAYAIRVRDRDEADEEQKNLSANYLKEQNIPSITLEEREIYELKFFKETGKHLDIENVTLCAGSRYDNGNVPSMNWYEDSELDVYWSDPDVTFDSLRSRQVVS